VETEALSDLIGRIYDCALDPGRWPEVLGRIARAVDAPVGMIAMHDLVENRPIRTFAYGMPAPAVWLYEARYATRNPIALALATRQVEGTVDTLGTLVEAEAWGRSPIYREFVRPLGLGDVLGVAALRSARRGVWLGTLRRRAQPRFGPTETRLFQLLSPHVVRAMRISDILELRAVEAARLTAVLDRLATAFWLVDDQARVLHANAAAQALLLRGGPLRVVRGRLAALRPAEASLLAAAIRDAAAGDFTRATQAALPLGDATAGEGLIATVLPLRGAGLPLRGAAPAAAAVCVQGPAEAPATPLQAFGALHGLTPAELRCLAEIALGRNVPEAAAALGVAATTARSHLNSIFETTGTASQAELVRLVASFAPPLRG
jgi:DNA-binding CsgD family transcriptional regulator/PAS domain-containing protein